MKFVKSLVISVMALALVGCAKTDVEVDNIPERNDSIESNIDTSSNLESSSDTIAEFSLGTWNGSTYTNDFLDLSYTLPENWIKYNDKQIAELMNLSSDLVYGDNEFLKEAAKLTSVYYLFTQDPLINNNVSVFSEKTILDVTPEYYLSQVKTQLEAMSNIKYVIGETSSEYIGGIEYTTLEATIEDSNISQKYYVRKNGNYFMGIIATSVTGENGINEIINCFY